VAIPSQRQSHNEADTVSREAIPAWLAQTEEEIQAFLRLPENWNSYGARPIAPHTLRAAMELLNDIVRSDTPRPIAIPTAGGGVQFEWHTRGIDLEIEIDAAEQVGVFYADPAADEEWELVLGSEELTPLCKPMERLSHA